MAPVSWLMAELLLVSSSSTHLQQHEDRPDCPQNAIAQDQLLPSQHILQQGDSHVDRVMGQAGGVQGGTAVTQVTEED